MPSKMPVQTRRNYVSSKPAIVCINTVNGTRSFRHTTRKTFQSPLCLPPWLVKVLRIANYIRCIKQKQCYANLRRQAHSIKNGDAAKSSNKMIERHPHFICKIFLSLQPLNKCCLIRAIVPRMPIKIQRLLLPGACQQHHFVAMIFPSNLPCPI